MVVYDGSRLDDYFQSLSHPYRRFVIRKLRDADEPLQIAELATEIASRDGQPDDDAIDRVRLQLHHRDLPILSRKGVIEYDPERGRVSPTEITTHLAAIVEIGLSITETEGSEGS